jgi:hypothetical protein
VYRIGVAAWRDREIEIEIDRERERRPVRREEIELDAMREQRYVSEPTETKYLKSRMLILLWSGGI